MMPAAPKSSPEREPETVDDDAIDGGPLIADEEAWDLYVCALLRANPPGPPLPGKVETPDDYADRLASYADALLQARHARFGDEDERST